MIPILPSVQPQETILLFVKPVKDATAMPLHFHGRRFTIYFYHSNFIDKPTPS